MTQFVSLSLVYLAPNLSKGQLRYPVYTISQVSSNRISDCSRDDNTVASVVGAFESSFSELVDRCWLVGACFSSLITRRDVNNRGFGLRETSSASGKRFQFREPDRESSFISTARFQLLRCLNRGENCSRSVSDELLFDERRTVAGCVRKV